MLHTYTTGQIESGTIDLLYRTNDTWRIIDFKTDALPSHAALDCAIAEHRRQLARYSQAVRTMLHIEATATLCFLDAQGDVAVHNLGSADAAGG
jgi:ATP-dependent exoDNAse (exonuclease V) beta subunit